VCAIQANHFPGTPAVLFAQAFDKLLALLRVLHNSNPYKAKGIHSDIVIMLHWSTCKHYLVAVIRIESLMPGIQMKVQIMKQI
jgi:hypothetical protein